MDAIHQILRNIPLFRSLTDSEIDILRTAGKYELIAKGKKIDLKKVKSFGIVISGMFDISRTNGDYFYLAPGSFFGDIPFINNRHQGVLRAVSDSEIIRIDPADIYRLLLSSFRGMRGFIKNLRKMGMEISEMGKETGSGTRIITVYSRSRDSGKSIFSSILGLVLSGHGDTLLLDASYDGNSLFSIFEKELIQALSQKPDGLDMSDLYIEKRIIKIEEGLSLLNMASGSRVRVNPDIISPVLFLLSKKYKYIVIDLSDSDTDLRNRILSLSDVIFPIIKSIKERESLYSIFDNVLREGQRVYYTLNRYYAKEVGSFEGGYVLADLEFNKKETIKTNLTDYTTKSSEQAKENEFINLILSKKTGLVLQTNLITSVFSAGFINSLYQSDLKIDFFYSSSWSYIITALFLMSGKEDFEDNFIKFFSESRINGFLDITFPEEYIFKNSKIYRYMHDLAGSDRIESFKCIPVAMLMDNNRNRRICSTGYIKDLITASFLIDPVFDPLEISGSYYNSGYPLTVKAGDILRTDIDEVIYVSLRKDLSRLNEVKLLKFYKSFTDNLYFSHTAEESNCADRVIILETAQTEYNLKDLLAYTEPGADKK